MLHGLNPRACLPSYIKTTGPERHWLTLIVPKNEQRLPGGNILFTPGYASDEFQSHHRHRRVRAVARKRMICTGVGRQPLVRNRNALPASWKN